ncbi:MAG: potassium transporter Kup [Betaproteobacteria bacterium]|nr:potassium transporter Kup [Betaproteobacteria bacterium]
MSTRHHGNDAPRPLTLLMIGALGVVFGDIGTSPLYALKVAVEAAGGNSNAALQAPVFGILSLITWALIVVVALKYVMIVMRADNYGEGGVFALTALVLRNMGKGARARWLATIAGTLGAALFFGDSLITPAISVLSAVEGLNVIAPELKPYIVYIAVALITALFAVERFGTAAVGAFFGPVMLLWFVVLGVLGLAEIVHNPGVLAALNPLLGIEFLAAHGSIAIAIIGAIVLAVTGGEALYADMGHFGRPPIQRAWFLVVLPCLLLNYFGQGALLIRDASALDNPFYRLAPEWALVPLLLLAFLATIIASQAVISGAFSIANQAVQLGYIPRLRVRHTSAEEIGQVYVSKINILLYLGVVCLVFGFGSSESLASAYGISVTGAMAIDTVLAAYVMMMIRGWNKAVFAPVFLFFLLIDLVFFGANLTKFLEGGWLPICVAAVTVLIMLAWIVGRDRLLAARWNGAVALDGFLASLDAHPIHRVEGTGIFMVPHDNIVPMALMHNLKHNKVLHERILLLRVAVRDVPFVADDDRVEITHHAHNFHSAVVHYGFMEEPNIPRVLAFLRAREFHFSLMEISFFIGKEKVVARRGSSWFVGLFILMHRMMLGATDFFKIPPGHAVEIGGHIEI